MLDKSKKFHEFALKSILFKGRTDWYFCYLKTEKIAHVLELLSARGGSPRLKDIAREAETLPADIARLAGGEFDPAYVLAQVFGLLSALRLAGTAGVIGVDNTALLVREYEGVAERLAAGVHLSPFVAQDDLSVASVIDGPFELPLGTGVSHGRLPNSPASNNPIKDTKGQSKGQPDGDGERASLILNYIHKHKSQTGQGATIKQIAATIHGCSDKTIQRELNSLISKGLIKRVGERRWSVYQVIE